MERYSPNQIIEMIDNNYPEFRQTSFLNGDLIPVYEKHPEFRQDILLNKFIDADFIAQIIEISDDDDMFCVAMKNSLNSDQILFLSKHPSSGVRNRIAYNKKTPIEILERLSEDSDEQVRIAAQYKLEERLRKK